MKYIINIIRILFLLLFIFLLVNGKVFIWLALFGISLIVALIFGRIYCGYICPMNTLMLPISWISKKTKIQTDKAPGWLKNGYFTWITLFASIAIMLMSKRLFQINVPILPFWLVISIIVTIRYRPYVFHNLICPFGALQRTFGRFAVFTKKVNKNKCISCELCSNACPSRAIYSSTENKKASINKTLCLQCTSCQQVCPTNAISYGITKD